jgi:Tol biopolymer transport system component
LLWVSPGVALPEGLNPPPDLLAYAGSMLYPITMNPPAVGQPVEIRVPGQLLDFAPGVTSAAAVPDPNAGQVILYDMAGSSLLTLPTGAAYGASYSPDGSMLAITSAGELAVSLYDTSSGSLINKLTGFETAAPVYGAGIVPGNQTIYWISRATLEFQDVATGQLGQKLNFQDFIGAHAFSPDGARLALTVSGKLLLYSVPDAQKLAEVTLSQPVTSLEFSPDGKLLASSYGPGLQIWDSATLAPVTNLAGPNNFTGMVTFSPDGRYLVSQHDSNVVEVWWVK